MMGRPIFRDQNYLITQDVGKGNKWYYTVVKDIGLHKLNPHAHFNNYRAAKLTLHWALKGRAPKRYSGYMKAAIQRLLMTKEDVLHEHNRKIPKERI
jgi:hypothetical protein